MVNDVLFTTVLEYSPEYDPAMSSTSTQKTLKIAARTPRRRADSEATRQKILDCAEELFAATGFHATSIRDIATRAEYQFALVSYHFGSKLELLDHVLARRSSVLNLERRQRLDELRTRASNRPIALRNLVESYIVPIMRRADADADDGDEGWRNYTRIIAAVSSNEEWSALIAKHFNETARLYLLELQRTLPTVSSKRLHQAFFILIGALATVCARPDRIETLSEGRFGSKEVSSLTSILCEFLEGGLKAVARSDDLVKKSQKK